MRFTSTTKHTKFASMVRPGLMLRGTLLLLVCLFGSQLSAAAQAAWQTESIALSPDGRFVAASFKPNVDGNRYQVEVGGIWLYDLEDLLAPARYLMESRYSDIEIDFSPDNAYVAVVDFEGLYVFRTADGSQVFQLQRPIITHWLDEASARIEFSPDSQFLKTFNIYKRGGPREDRALLIPFWDFKRGQHVNTVETHPIDPWTRVWLSPDWKQIVVFEYVFDFDIETGTGGSNGALGSPGYSGFHDGLDELFHEDGTLFATSTHDCIVQILETNSWTVSKTWEHPDSECEYGISAFDFSHSQPLLAFTDHPTYWQLCERLEQARLVVWNYEEDVVVFEAATYTSNSRFTQDDRFIVASKCDAGDDDAQISVWDKENDFDFRTYPGSSPQLHPNSELMVTIGHDGNIWIWNISQYSLVAILPAIAS